MTEPSLALQTAIRSRLVATPAVTALVQAARIVDGPTRPEHFPSIILGEGQTVQAGRAYSWRNIWVYLTIHVWALESGTEAVRTITNEIDRAFLFPLTVPGFQLIDGNFRVADTRFMRDPTGLNGHGVMSVQALMSEMF